MGGALSDTHLVSWFNFGVPMYFAALLSFANIFLLLWLYKESFQPSRKLCLKWSLAVSLFVSAFKDKTVRLLSVAFFIFIIGWANFYSFTAFYGLHRYHMDAMMTTLLMAVMGVGFAVGMGYATKYFQQWFGLKRGAIFCLILAALMILLILLIDCEWALWAFMAPAACFASVAYVMSITIFSTNVDADRQGWVMGITGAIMALGFAITLFSSGVLTDFGASVPYSIAVMGLLLGAIIIMPQKLPS